MGRCSVRGLRTSEADRASVYRPEVWRHQYVYTGKPPAERQRLRLACGSCICGVSVPVTSASVSFAAVCAGVSAGLCNFRQIPPRLQQSQTRSSDLFDQEERLVAALTGQNHLATSLRHGLRVIISFSPTSTPVPLIRQIQCPGTRHEVLA